VNKGDAMSNYSVEKSAKTVEEAVRLALIELDAKEENVSIDVIQESSKGFLGIGSKDALVKVSLKEFRDRIAKDFLRDVFEKMNIFAKIETRIENKNLIVNVEGDDLGVLIGKRGQTLDSLQYLVSLVVNKNNDDYLRVVMDTENYREKRKETLERLAHKLAFKAKRLRKDIVLEPMNPFERRIIHAALQSNPQVGTRSEGDEPYRKVIIFLNR
jgi:spoIIIJ-associated protein